MRLIQTWKFLTVLSATLILHGCQSLPSEGIDSLQAEYKDFVHSLNIQRFKNGYPVLVKKLAAPDRETRITAVRTIGQSGEVDSIPLIVDLVLEDEDRTVRIWAGSALENIVTANELKRRDPTHPEKVVILPRTHDDIDLRPLAWVLNEMLAKPDDGSAHSCGAATMIGYLDLKRFEPDLRRLLESRHPAVTRSAVHALRMMDFEVENEPHPLNWEYQDNQLIDPTWTTPVLKAESDSQAGHE